MTGELLPQRKCDGCGQVDDHPRMSIQLEPDPAPSRLFHYDCVPDYLREQFPTPAYEATAKGLRGEDVRQVVVKHGLKIEKEAAK